MFDQKENFFSLNNLNTLCSESQACSSSTSDCHQKTEIDPTLFKHFLQMCTHSIFGSSSRCCHSHTRTCSHTRTRLNKTRLSLSHSPIDSFSAYRSFPHMTGRCCSVLFADQLSTILSRSLSPHTHTLTLSFSRRLLSLSLSLS